MIRPPHPRALLLVLDSVGIGHAPDAAEYGDAGADTLGHILEHELDLRLPTLDALGLAAAGALASGASGPEIPATAGLVGAMTEASAGKDTTTGHWELAGVRLTEAFATFQRFPDELVNAIAAEAGVEFLGNVAASGTAILDELGAAHVASGQPILYTSADSVLQIAAHEDVIVPAELYRICEVARRHCDAWRIGRVIARPFVGQEGNWQRTANRHDFSLIPPPTVLNALVDAGVTVTGVGKIADIFAGRGVSASHPTRSNAHGMAVIDELWANGTKGLIFANLVDFDMLFGHRRDVAGYARALGEFDAWLGGFLERASPADLVIITADHGNDPTWRGTDHTRERVPLLVRCGAARGSLGVRESFADVAATVAAFFDVPWNAAGQSFLPRGKSASTGHRIFG